MDVRLRRLERENIAVGELSDAEQVNVVAVFITAPSESVAVQLSKMLVTAKVAACVNRLQCSSSYWWNDKVEDDQEILLVNACSHLSHDQTYHSCVVKYHATNH